METSIKSNAHDLALVLLEAAKAAPSIDLLQDFVFKRGNDDNMVLLMTSNTVLAHLENIYPRGATGYAVPAALLQWAQAAKALGDPRGRFWIYFLTQWKTKFSVRVRPVYFQRAAKSSISHLEGLMRAGGTQDQVKLDPAAWWSENVGK